MIVLDANILLYAWNQDAPQHSAVISWVENLVDSGTLVGLPWVTTWGFLRVSTNHRLYPRPATPSEAHDYLSDWLSIPNVLIVQPGPRHFDILKSYMTEFRVTGPDVTDAVLAALTTEHGATLASTDRDFGRFSGLSWINPLSQN